MNTFLTADSKQKQKCATLSWFSFFCISWVIHVLLSQVINKIIISNSMGNCDSSINDYGETDRVRFNQTAANIVKEVSTFAIHNQMEKVMFGIESLHERSMLYNNLNSLASSSASPHSELLGLHSHRERRNKDVMTRIGGPTVFIACHNFSCAMFCSGSVW